MKMELKMVCINYKPYAPIRYWNLYGNGRIENNKFVYLLFGGHHSTNTPLLYLYRVIAHSGLVEKANR